MAAAFVALTGATAAAQSEIVLHTKNATKIAGDWHLFTDSTAAGGTRIYSAERGAAKLTAPSASPADYFELTFNAEANRAYRLWIRGKADYNAYTNDSVFVQFSGSVTAAGSAAYRIGTTSATWAGIEPCSGCGLSGWGWEDNYYGGDAPPIYFATTGPQTIRVQRREDGISLDQIVLSAGQYLYSAPGGTREDRTLLPATTATTAPAPEPTPTPTPEPTPTEPAPTTPPPPAGSTAEILITSNQLLRTAGEWRLYSDGTAANSTAIGHPDRGAAKLSQAYASPSNYAEFTFAAEAGRTYRLWIRGKADYNNYTNDSVFVQYTNSLDVNGAAVARIGTTSAHWVSIEEGSGAGLSEWGWQDNGYGEWGPLVKFATSGTQTLRLQTREDGLRIDQIVLSSSTYLNAAPGAAKNDHTILSGTTTASPTPTEPTPTEPTPTEPTPSPIPPPNGVRLRVMEWNLHHGVGTDGVYNLDRIATWITYAKPDVVLLNEVERFTYWGQEDQPARYKALLEQKTGRRWYSHFAQEFGQWSSNGKGHQILSVYPFDSVSYSTITQSSGLGGAGAAAQATIMVNGRTINFVLTHLDPYDPAMRLTQAQDVLRWAAGFAENRILVGDMNAWPDQASILEIYKTYNNSWDLALAKGTAYASTAINPYGATKNGRIDYILLSKGSSNLVVLDSQVYDTRDSSGVMPTDHRPIITTFEVR
jgi:endonuclease/exonuclease/phosphatase family metal-dependent hydrolase